MVRSGVPSEELRASRARVWGTLHDEEADVSFADKVRDRLRSCAAASSGTLAKSPEIGVFRPRAAPMR
jgi:hypothetical protein